MPRPARLKHRARGRQPLRGRALPALDCHSRGAGLAGRSGGTDTVVSDAMNYPERFNQRYPFAFWAYLALLGLFFVDASLFASATVSVTPLNVAIFGLLTFGLLTGSRICRWILIALSLIAAFSILAVLAGAGNFADAMLVVIPLGQAATLFSPSARDFTDSRARRPI